jgi:hypothetical protein
VSTSWDEAAKCPEDGSTGKVTGERALPRSEGGGKLVTLACLLNRCTYSEESGMGWAVQVRADNTIPDKVDPATREKYLPKASMPESRKQVIRDALAQQVEDEMKAGTEIRRF